MKKLKSFADEGLFDAIKGDSKDSKDFAIQILGKWYEKCRTDYEIRSINDAWSASYFFLEKLTDRKHFEKAVEKLGYDIENIMLSIWERTEIENLKNNAKQMINENDRLKAEIAEFKNTGVVTPRALKEKDEKYNEMYNRLSTALNQERAINEELKKNNGGKKMADNEITKWEYKRIDTSSEEVLNELGEQGWEVAGTYSSDTNPNQTLLKRPKVKQRQPDYGYERS